jgi:TRAP-type C4-dicarboxylate transport system permease large subunit
VLTWPAPVVDWLHDADDSLPWAAGLPEVAVAAVLCHDLAALARRAEDLRAGRWLEVTRTLTVVAGLMPVLVLGGRLASLAVPAEVAAVAAPALLVVLMFRYGGRPWAAAPSAHPDSSSHPDRTGPLH